LGLVVCGSEWNLPDQDKKSYNGEPWHFFPPMSRDWVIIIFSRRDSGSAGASMELYCLWQSLVIRPGLISGQRIFDQVTGLPLKHLLLQYLSGLVHFGRQPGFTACGRVISFIDSNFM